MFVDIHNHILPGIDDGAHTLGEAVEMARRAAAGGTDILVATPHQFWPGRKGAPADWLRGLVLELQAMLDRENIPLRVVPGVEAKIGLHVVEELQQGDVLTLGDAGRWVLMEPPFDRIPPGALSTLREVRRAGFDVVLAHPERSRDIQQNLAFVEACADLGLAFQLTTGSLLGNFGKNAQATAERILARAADWPIVIASDTHDLHERSPDLMAAAQAVAARLVGPDEARRMVDERPRAMVSPLPVRYNEAGAQHHDRAN